MVILVSSSFRRTSRDIFESPKKISKTEASDLGQEIQHQPRKQTTGPAKQGMRSNQRTKPTLHRTSQLPAEVSKQLTTELHLERKTENPENISSRSKASNHQRRPTPQLGGPTFPHSELADRDHGNAGGAERRGGAKSDGAWEDLLWTSAETQTKRRESDRSHGSLDIVGDRERERER